MTSGTLPKRGWRRANRDRRLRGVIGSRFTRTAMMGGGVTLDVAPR